METGMAGRIGNTVSASLLLGIERLAHHDSRVHGDALLDATLADAGISRTDRDLVVLVKRYEPSCALLSAALHAARHGTT